MSLEADYEVERKRYLNHAIDHQTFYRWLADRIHVTEKMVPFTIAQLCASNDPWFNDLPLARWDFKDFAVRRQAFSYGMNAWSMSDTVCVLKAVALRAVEREKAGITNGA